MRGINGYIQRYAPNTEGVNSKTCRFQETCGNRSMTQPTAQRTRNCHVPYDVTATNCNKQVIGMAYVPVQLWRDIEKSRDGFEQGTIFHELYKPFTNKRGGMQ